LRRPLLPAPRTLQLHERRPGSGSRSRTGEVRGDVSAALRNPNPVGRTADLPSGPIPHLRGRPRARHERLRHGRSRSSDPGESRSRLQRRTVPRYQRHTDLLPQRRKARAHTAQRPDRRPRRSDRTLTSDGLQVSTDDAAEGPFAGSPTITLNGEDLFPGADPSVDLACRIYATRRVSLVSLRSSRSKTPSSLIATDSDQVCTCCGRSLSRKKLR